MSTKLEGPQILIVDKDDIIHYTSSIGSVIHPIKGRILFATNNIPKGGVIAPLSMQRLNYFHSKY